MEPSYPVSANVSQCIPDGKQRFLRKLRRELPYDLAVPPLGIYLDKTLIQKDMHPDVHSSTIHNSQNMETA